jgi:hypothetical protein
MAREGCWHYDTTSAPQLRCRQELQYSFYFSEIKLKPGAPSLRVCSSLMTDRNRIPECMIVTSAVLEVTANYYTVRLTVRSHSAYRMRRPWVEDEAT